MDTDALVFSWRTRTAPDHIGLRAKVSCVASVMPPHPRYENGPYDTGHPCRLPFRYEPPVPFYVFTRLLEISSQCTEIAKWELGELAQKEKHPTIAPTLGRNGREIAPGRSSQVGGLALGWSVRGLDPLRSRLMGIALVHRTTRSGKEQACRSMSEKHLRYSSTEEQHKLK